MTTTTTILIWTLVFLALGFAALFGWAMIKLSANKKQEEDNEDENNNESTTTANEKDGDTDETDTDKNGEGTSTTSEEEVKPCTPCPEKGALETAKEANATSANNSERIDKLEKDLAAEKAAREEREAKEAEAKNAPRKNELDKSIRDDKLALAVEKEELKSNWDKYLAQEEKKAGNSEELSRRNAKSTHAATMVKVTAFKEVGNATVGYGEALAIEGNDLTEAGNAVNTANEALGESSLNHQPAVKQRVAQEGLVEADAKALKALKEAMAASIGEICIIKGRLIDNLNEWANISTPVQRHSDEETILAEIKAIDKLIAEIGKKTKA
jgi:hypothetical protein